MADVRTIIIENGNIYETDYMGQKKECLGVTADVFNQINNGLKEAVEKAEQLQKERDEYYKLGVDNGYIKKPKTQEEIYSEFVDNQNKIMNALENFNKRLEVLEDGHKQSVELVDNTKGNTKK